MRRFVIALGLICGPGWVVASGHDDGFSYTLELASEYSEIDGLSLGDDPDRDRLVEQDYEVAFSLEYQASDRLYYYFGGAFVDESEAEKPRGERESLNGFERGEIGVGYGFGDEIESELRAGRREFVSTSNWWYWWDEELDSISLESRFGKFEFLVALAEEQAREVSGMDRIDPELKDLRRVLARFDWEIAGGQLLQIYYLDQRDDSASYRDGQLVREDRIDEEDADLTWTGISYLGWFEDDRLGEIEIEFAWARVDGSETVFDLDDPAGGFAEVDETTRQDVSGDAFGFRAGWSPAAFDDVSFIVGHARASGDKTEDDGKNESFRQTGLQGEAEVFGKLYQPELSNLVVDTIGIEFGLADNVDVGLFRHDFRQDRVAEDMRDVAIDVDTIGSGRALGSEIDLIFTFEVYDVEIDLTAARFEAGSAYGSLRGETSHYWQLELSYVF